MSRGNRRRWSVWLTRTHRWAGVTAALFTLVLAGTGIALQHAPALGLDRQAVGSASVARALGIEAGPLHGFDVGGDWLVGSREALYLGARRIHGAPSEAPDGAVATGFGFAVAAGGHILLVDDAGRVLEHLRGDGALPGPVQRLGRTADGAPVVATADGRYRPRRRWLEFAPFDGDVAAWSNASEPPPALARALRRDILARAVTWERLLLALHSGRIGGNAGVFVMDAAAVLLLVLAGSGLYLWWRRR